jgi:hypothetical protein
MLTAETQHQMKQIARFSPDQVDAMLQQLAATDANTWRQSMNLLILTMFAELMKTRALVWKHHKLIAAAEAAAGSGDAGAAAEPRLPGAPPAAVVGGMPANGGVRLGADGQPITDPTQLQAEALLDAATGTAAPAAGAPRAVVGAPPAANGRQRFGADGQPITDPAQLEAESIMDQALGG